VTLTLPVAELTRLAGDDRFEMRVVVGPDAFPRATGGTLETGRKLAVGDSDLEITIPGMSGAILMK